MTCVHFVPHQLHVSCTHNCKAQKLYNINFVVASINNLVVNNNICTQLHSDWLQMTRFLLVKHVRSTTYYPQGNGQAKFTNKVISKLLTKLTNEKRTNQDEHLSIVLFSYMTTYKVTTRYTPYQLVYGLHPLMLIEYVILAISGDHIDAEPTRILIVIITKLEKLQQERLEA